LVRTKEMGNAEDPRFPHGLVTGSSINPGEKLRKLPGRHPPPPFFQVTN